MKYRSRSNMDDCTQEAMLRCVHVLRITGYWTNRETDLRKSVDREI